MLAAVPHAPRGAPGRRAVPTAPRGDKADLTAGSGGMAVQCDSHLVTIELDPHDLAALERLALLELRDRDRHRMAAAAEEMASRAAVVCVARRSVVRLMTSLLLT